MIPNETSRTRRRSTRSKPHLGLIAGTEEPVRVYAAHKADYEQMYYKPPDASWICTWKVAVTVWPDAPGHKNQELRYWLGLTLRPEMCARPHRAPDDAYVTAAILVRALQTSGLTVQQMVKISAGPIVLPYLTFGMHAMKSLTARTMTADGWAYEVPSGYLEWMLKQKDMDVNARHTAFHHLNARRIG